MNCGPVAEISEQTVDRINAEVSEQILQHHDDVPDDLRLMAKLGIAATGGHVAVEDRFFFYCMHQIVGLSGKALARWKDKVDDSKGTRRRVYWSDGMIRVNDNSGTAVPLVPMSISLHVNEHSAKDLTGRVIPHFLRQRLEQRVFQSRPLPPVRPMQQPRPRPRLPSSFHGGPLR